MWRSQIAMRNDQDASWLDLHWSSTTAAISSAISSIVLSAVRRATLSASDGLWLPHRGWTEVFACQSNRAVWLNGRIEVGILADVGVVVTPVTAFPVRVEAW